MNISQCKLIDLPVIKDERGCLSYIEQLQHIPFNIKRVYYLYDITPGVERGGHAHRDLQQLIVALSGSFDIYLDDGFQKRNFHLSEPNIGLYVSPMNWRELNNFSPGSVCLVLASQHYDESDYYRSYEDFIQNVKGN